ncbi:hypothetical protein C8J57DRAFT_1258139 [Mycena rebaudengoi]|nr:hypothetical protein C8J57DRAFT_1258139 [Mycena rebaudengoi]
MADGHSNLSSEPEMTGKWVKHNYVRPAASDRGSQHDIRNDDIIWSWLAARCHGYLKLPGFQLLRFQQIDLSLMTKDVKSQLTLLLITHQRLNPKQSGWDY